MAKLVLDVGQCVPDHASIRRLVETNYDAQVVQTHGLADTLAELNRGQFALVLINRKLDADYTDGLEILQAIKGDAKLAATPVMIVTNYAEHQQTAVSAGAEPGFGKAELGKRETHEKLSRYLEPKRAAV